VRGRAQVLTVYVAEAHAQDEWTLRGTVMVNQPRNSAERFDVARRFAAALDWRLPLLADPPEDEAFERLFAPWPIRFYVVGHDGRMAFIAAPIDSTFDLCEVERQLEQAITHGRAVSGRPRS
jgi:hypothetical protein